MKLISCHVENYGRLHQLDLKFEDGLNVMLEENGWGKSTLVSFFGAMFYGFDGDRKQKTAENERRHYSPWQGGAYGGTIVFETGGGCYTLTRVFRDREANDSFDLRDTETNLTSQDYTVHIGEELFGVDKESFLRTVLIRQNLASGYMKDGKIQLLGEEGAVTDDMNVRIGGKDEAGDTYGRMETAGKIMKDVLNRYSPKMKTGVIRKLNEEIADLDTRQRASAGLEKEAALLKQRQKENEDGRRETEAAIKALENMRKRAADEKIMAAERLQLDRLKADLDSAKKNYDAVRNEAGEAVPDQKSIEDTGREIGRLNELRKNEAEGRMTAEERKIYEKLLPCYGEKCPSSAEVTAMLADVKEAAKNRKVLEQKTEELRKVYEARGKDRGTADRRGLIVLAVGVVIFLAGIGLIIFASVQGKSINPGIIAAFAGMLLALLGGVMEKRTKDSSDKTLEKEMRALLTEKEETELFCAESEQAVRNFLKTYGTDYDEAAYVSQLDTVLENAAVFRQLSKKNTAGTQDSDSSAEALSARLKEWFFKYGLEADESDFTGALAQIQRRASELRAAAGALKEAAETLKHFAAVHDTALIGQFRPTPGLPDEEHLEKKIDSARLKLTELQEKTAQLNRSLYENGEACDARRRAETELEALRKKRDRLAENYAILERTQQLLRKADAAQGARISGPMLESFRKYYELLTGRRGDCFRIDAELHITVNEEGAQRETALLSGGWRDLTGLCFRMACADAMFPGEKPVLFMDDPFVNLDEEKTERGKIFLRKIAERYQVIYLTCHVSRA